MGWVGLWWRRGLWVRWGCGGDVGCGFLVVIGDAMVAAWGLRVRWVVGFGRCGMGCGLVFG